MAQAGLCLTWSEPLKTGYLASHLKFNVYQSESQTGYLASHLKVNVYQSESLTLSLRASGAVHFIGNFPPLGLKSA